MPATSGQYKDKYIHLQDRTNTRGMRFSASNMSRHKQKADQQARVQQILKKQTQKEQRLTKWLKEEREKKVYMLGQKHEKYGSVLKKKKAIDKDHGDYAKELDLKI